ncbi:MAG TPA: response regulator [Blastocatellia bacterium]|nr:response regulator [Blastocatellia bacterium]
MASEPFSVLLVDDHQDTRAMLELLLDEWGYRATIVSTATEGLKHLLDRSFDIIVLDNWLPDLDGIELCRQIREFNRATPIVFFSAAAMGSEDRAALAAGANAYVYKGTGLGNLREAMAGELRKSNSQHRKHPQ